jgi:hypothetical protein
MSESNYAGWLPEAAPGGIVRSSVEMEGLSSAMKAPEAAPAPSGSASWLPPSVQRRHHFDDAAEARATRAEERDRADRAEAAADRAVAAYRAAAEARGDSVSAMALATGEGIGRSLQDVLGDAIAAGDREDARSAARDRRQEWLGAGEPSIGRSRDDGWPESSYEADRQIRQADQLHRDLVVYRARHDPFALEAARAKSTAAR